MKTINKYIHKSLVFFTATFSLLFFACSDVGLGEEVDTEPPVIQVTSHADNDVVPSEFTLSGTASDNTEVTLIRVDFDYQDLHYQVVPGGTWQKKNGDAQDWEAVTDGEGYCSKSGNVWSWSIYIRSDEGKQDGTTYELSAYVKDAIGNSGKKSKADLSLLLDQNNPDVSIYKPELFTGLAESIENETSSYALCDGNVISKLLNGDLTFTGRQSGSISFKELRIEFDNGKLSAGTRKVTGDAEALSTVDEIAENVNLGDDEELTVYYFKTLKRGEEGISDLRNWEISVPQSAWVTSEKNAELLSLGTEVGSAKMIRVVSTSLSDSGAWERKVIGWFLWWPEADIPWVQAYLGDDADNGEDTYPIYPSSNLTGIAQDDDGIKSFSYSIEMQDATGAWKENTEKTDIALSNENATYTAFSLKMPSVNGKYRINFTVTDIYGTSSTTTKYIRVLDVNPPKINLNSPENGSSVLADSKGNITFEGTVGDDGSVSSFSLIYLNPIANDDSVNILRYMGGSETEWSLATESGTLSHEYMYTAKDGTEYTYQNKIYKISLGEQIYDETEKLNLNKVLRTLNIFTDLGISVENPQLITQYFVLRAVDNSGTTTVEQIALTGDTESPSLEISSIQQFASDDTKKIDEFTYTNDSVPTLEPVKSTDYVILKGTWYDNSVKAWGNDRTYLSEEDIQFEWKDAEFEITSCTKNSDDSWNWIAKVTNVPKKSSSINASLTDLAGNIKNISRSVFIETAELGLERISAENNDGSYNSGDINITFDFTKNTRIEKGSSVPYLVLNNGGKAYYTSGGESGNAKAEHIFTYTIGQTSGEKDTKGLNDTDTLDVVEFVSNGAKYYDASVTGGEPFEIDLPTENEAKLGTSRSIKIDRTAPKISSVNMISSSGYYNESKTILFMISFDETVSISDVENLGVEFTAFTPSSVSAQASGNNILVTYTVTNGENSTVPLAIKNFTGTDNVIVLDEAGNALSDWSWSTAFDKNIYIDTTPPVAPTINAAWGSAKLVTAATSFTLTGIESGATAEYSIDGGTNWQTYKNTAISLSNNGSYIIKARQTDRAGNVSTVSDGGTIVVEKGDFLSKITADTVSGTYSVNKGGSILGRIVFRKNIALPSGATVTLNAKNSSGTQYVLALTKDSSATMSGGADYTFIYNIQEGDYIDGSAALSVTSWSFTSVTYSTGVSGVGDVTFDMSFSNVVTSGKRFTDNRTIYILTGNPTVQSATLGGTVNSDGTVSSPKLTIAFDRAVSKVSGNITLSLEGDSYSDKFIAPAVISTSDWNSAFKDYYTVGLNGATGSVGSTLTNDNTTKYVLNWSTEPTDSTLVSLFETAGWNKVEVPIVASAVALSTDKKTVTVDLSSTYKLPIMGAMYKVTVPAGAFADEVQNKNKEYVSSATAVGVEPPVIRINKGNQTITPGASPNFTTDATVTMPDTAEMRIDCQTPGAVIYYNKTEKPTTTYQVIKSGQKYDTKSNAEKTIPAAPEPKTQYSTSVPLGSSVADYASATGLKVAISAVAKKESVPSENSFEYATRTVLKLNIESGGYSQSTDGNASTVSDIKENGSSLTFNKLKVWVWGGDYSYGGNSISPFPLSWSDTSCFKLMKTESGFESDMASKWYWISWDITTATYHGFILGDVPEDAKTLGPSEWYSGEGGWDSQKPNYILYPGETLEMYCSSSVTYSNGQFHWQKKNHGKR